MARSLTHRAAGALVASPFFAVVGLVVILAALMRTPRFVRRFVAVLRCTLSCPNGHPNAVLARWTCPSCGSTYHGWVGRCPICGAGALGFECDQCGVTVALPWEDR